MQGSRCVQVLGRISSKCHPLITRLHDVFFKPCHGAAGLHYCYRTGVTAAEVKQALRDGCAAQTPIAYHVIEANLLPTLSCH